jgi:ribonuclease T2
MSGARAALLVALILAAVVASFFAGIKHTGRTTAPGTFDYYVLVLGWSPSYCLSEGRARNDSQCSHSRAVVLHGLWPQYEKGWPEDCRTTARPWVPQQVIDDMRDIMPSRNLVIHEYRTHGTCSGLDPAQYFKVAHALYDRVKLPESFVDSAGDRRRSPEEIESEFLAANPWLKPDMIAIACRGGNLLDVRIRFGRDLAPRSCGANEEQDQLCAAHHIAVPSPAPQ